MARQSSKSLPLAQVVIAIQLSPNPEQSDADQLEAAADRAIADCDGDAREVVKVLILANHFLETELDKLRAAASPGYARLPRDLKDWYD